MADGRAHVRVLSVCGPGRRFASPGARHCRASRSQVEGPLHAMIVGPGGGAKAESESLLSTHAGPTGSLPAAAAACGHLPGSEHAALVTRLKDTNKNCTQGWPKLRDLAQHFDWESRSSPKVGLAILAKPCTIFVTRTVCNENTRGEEDSEE